MWYFLSVAVFKGEFLDVKVKSNLKKNGPEEASKKRDRNLSDDALVWTAVFIDVDFIWIDLFEFIGLTMFIWLNDWEN